MKFLRINEDQPKRTAEVLDALETFNTLYAMQREMLANSNGKGKVITASLSMLKYRIAKIVESAEMSAKTELLLANVADELSQIKRRNPDTETQKAAIGEWLFNDKDGYWKFLWETLFHSYVPKLTNALRRGIGNAPPIPEDMANEIAIKALDSFMEQKDKASIVNSLFQFDASLGSLLTWLEGGIKSVTQSLVNKYITQQNKETSMNQTIGDNDTEMGDMIAQEGEDQFEITTYAEKAEKLFTALTNYLRNAVQKFQQIDNPAEKYKMQVFLESMMSKDAEGAFTLKNTPFIQNLKNLSKLGEQIDEYGDDLRSFNNQKNEIIYVLKSNTFEQNFVDKARKKLAEIQNKIEQLEADKKDSISEFDSIYSKLEDMSQHDVSTGATIVDTPLQEPIGTNQSQDPANINQPQDVSPTAGTPEQAIRTKARGNRVLLSPADQALIEGKMQGARDKLRPSMFRTLSFPQIKKDLRAKSGNLYNLKEVADNINTPEDYDALVQGDLSKASVQAIYADIVVRGMLYVRDQGAMDKIYDPEVVVSGSEEMRRALNKFYKFVENEVQTNEILNAKEAEYQSLTPEEQAKLALNTKTTRGLSPKAFVLAKLSELIVDPNASQAGQEVNRFRTMYEYFDHQARAAAYDAQRNELFPGKDWDELTDEERNTISNNVYTEQYGGHRPMYVGKYRDKSLEKKKFEPRYPMVPDAEGTKYPSIMNKELWRIGRERAMSKYPDKVQERYPDQTYHQYRNPAWNTNNWYEISDNEEDFKNRNKQRNETIAESGLINVLVRIANALDSLGAYSAADNVSQNIKRLSYG